MKTKSLLAAVGLAASVLIWSGTACADFASRCSGCHGALNNQPQNSGPIRTANNRAYLDYKITNGMGGFSGDGNGGYTSLPAAQRDAIVAEIATVGYGPTFTSSVPPGGTAGVSYSHQVSTDAKPSSTGTTAIGNHLYAIVSGGLPPGLGLDIDGGLISGVPTTGGTYTGTIRANNLVGFADQAFSIVILTPPSNDNFSSAATLAGGNTSATASSTSATKQFGEPNHAGNAGGHSVWWNWTAPSTNPVTMHTCYYTNFFNGQTLTRINQTFDTLLAVYTGNAVNALTPIISNDDTIAANCYFTTSSYLTFNAIQGTTYRVAVDGYNGASGNIRLTLYQEQILKVVALNTIGSSGRVVSSLGGIDCLDTSCTASLAPGTMVTLTATPQPGSAFGGWSGGGCSGYGPTCSVTVNAATTVFANFRAMPNDDFANRIVLASGVTSGFGYNSTATKETGEPDHGGRAGGKSLWWTWTAPSTGSAHITLAGSDFDTLLGVYTGTAVDALTLVAGNDDFGGSLQSEVIFYATAGTQYHFAVDGFGAAFGTINFQILQPGNDNFLERLTLIGGTVNVVDVSGSATREINEPSILGNVGGHSLWWSWTAPLTRSVTITTAGSNFDTLLAVYTGASYTPPLTLVTSNDDVLPLRTSSVTFNATAGTTYQITVDGYGGASGNVSLNILQVQPQTITFNGPSAQPYSPTAIVLAATATSALPVAFSSTTPAICTVSGVSLTMVTVGTCTIAANQAGNASYDPAPQVLQSFVISQAAQSVTFGAQAAQSFANGGTFMLNPLAVASSGLAVTYVSNSLSVCTVAGSNVNMQSAGSCSMTASQSGSANYAPAIPVTVLITINPGSQVITFPAQGAQLYSPGGSFMISPAATASSGLPVTYGSATPLVCTVSGGTVSIVGTGNCTVTANQGGDANFNPSMQASATFTINPSAPGAPLIGGATPGNTTASIAFTPSANNGGSPITNFRASCNPGSLAGSGGTSPVTVTGMTNGITYTCSVTATNSAMLTSLPSAPVNVTPTGTPVPPTFSSGSSAGFTVLSAGTFTVTATGTPAPTLSASGTLPAGVTFTPGTGALIGTPATGTVGSYPLTFTATNSSGTVMQSFTLTVQTASQSITFANPGAQSVGGAPITLTANATSMLSVSFVSNTPSTCSVSGASLNLLAVGSCTVTASQAGNADFNAATPVPQAFMISAGTQTITFPAQAVASRSYSAGGSFAISPLASASSGLPVSYSSTTPSVCTVSGTTVGVLSAGTCTLAANQPGNAGYAAATQQTRSVTITANVPGAPGITSATPGDTQASIAFTAPADNGGSAVTLYTATCNPGVITGNAMASPITVSTLTNNTTYSCSVKATNAAGSGASSTGVQVTPLSSQGSTIWATTCATGGCHGAGTLPAPPRFNAAGSTTTVLDYVIATQPAMSFNPGVTGLNSGQRAAVSAYLLSQAPPIAVSTPFNTPVPIDVFGNIILNTISFTAVTVVNAPANGMLTTFNGTQVTYTPNPGFTGTDSFTYRGMRTSPSVVNGDAREVTITVQPSAPTINSAASASGTFGQAFTYQITATNLPGGYAVSGLPTGLAINITTGVISGMPTVTGTFNAMMSAMNVGGTDTKPLTVTIAAASQFITFPAQVSLTRSFSPGGTFPINPPATGGASGNAVVYGSATPAVCTVSNTTVTIAAAGVCTLKADQAGNANYLAAPTATQGVTITPGTPGAPVNVMATAGNASAVITFSPPVSNGGSPVTQYTVTCNNGAVPVSGPMSPITVSQLTIGLQYICSVTATTSGGTSMPSGTVMVTPVSIAYTGNVFSRKTHAGVDHDLALNGTALINGAIQVEPRAIGSGHRIVFVFNSPVTSVTSLSVLDASMLSVGTASSSFSGNDLIVTLTGIPDNKRVTVTATGVNGALTVSTSIGFLVGDVSNSQSVSAADISAVKARVGQSANMGNNYLFDLDLSGTITNADVSAVKARSGLVMP